MELVQKWTNGECSVILDLSELQEIIDRIPERVDEVVRKVAAKAEVEMKKRAVWDTGAMRASIYFVTERTNNYQSAAEAAMSKAAQGSKTTRPHAVSISPHPSPPRFTAYVGPSVEYAVYVEFGHHSLAPRPFVIPGLLAAAPYIEKFAPELFE